METEDECAKHQSQYTATEEEEEPRLVTAQRRTHETCRDSIPGLVIRPECDRAAEGLMAEAHRSLHHLPGSIPHKRIPATRRPDELDLQALNA